VPTTIVLVRHGETDWNRERRFQGHADEPLNDAGRAQVLELAERLEGERFAAAYTSPLRRACESAAILGSRLGLIVEPNSALAEVDVGSWSGLTVHEVEERFPEGFRRWNDWKVEGWDDGERYEDLSRRVVGGLIEIAARHPDDRVLAVTHGGPIRSALAAVRRLGADELRAANVALDNCAVVRIAVRDGKLEQVD
jgi:2,3-bisphosphoglycerate-dependent phosphoglycerate mutase